MKALLSICFCLLSCLSLTAQEGGYFLTHYSPGKADINNVNFDIAQNQRGIICIANRAGVVKFDGKSWERIQTPTAVFAVAVGNDNVIYTGGTNGFGKISNRQEDYQKFILLSDSTVSGIFDMLIYNNKLYGINSSTVFIYDLQSGDQQSIKSNYSGELLKLINIGSRVYVNTEIGGLKLIDEKKLTAPEAALEGKFIEFAATINNQTYLVGDADDQLFIYDNKRLKPLNIQSEYLSESIAIDAAWISDSLVAIATLKGGVVFINPQAQKIKQIVNYTNGLPDNEIFAMALDSHQGLWVAHKEGFTRISPSFPFRSFDRYPGLEGDLLAVQNHKNRLYVGTSVGLFYLDEVKRYTEKKIIDKQVVNQPSKKEGKQRQGLFGFLKRNKRDREKPTNTQYTTRVEKTLLGVDYEYKKVEGINSKVLQLSSKGDQLFSGGLDGLFEIKGSAGIQITRAPVRTFYVSKNYNKVFINTYEDKFEVHENKGGAYIKTALFNDFTDWVSYIFEDHRGRVWFCSSNELYWIKLEGNDISDSKEYQIDNPFYYETYGVPYKDSVYFVNESGIFVLDEDADRLNKTQDPDQQRYIKDNNGTVWLLEGDKWQTLGANFTSDQLDILSVFTDVEHISYDEEKRDFWVLTNDKNLYRINPDLSMEQSLAEYDLYLKDIRTTDEIFLPKPKLRFNQQSGPLTFEFVQPEYSGVINTEYQYKLIGLNDTWSEWSTGYNIIPIPYLPDGDYELHMRSRNIVTGIKEMAPIKFVIVPPYWKRPWFLALEFSALALLLYLTVKLKKLGYKYRMMSRLLALLTLIIIIEFIQTVAENEFGTETSPVIDFIIQIIVAIIILPVEGLIRRYVFREKNVQILDFISLKNKDK